MFKSFILVNQDHGYDMPPDVNIEDIAAAKICVNLRNVDAIQQTGRWVRNPNLPTQERDEFAPPVARRPGTAAARNAARRNEMAPQVFRLDADRFNLTMKNGNAWTVIGNFEELADILANFISHKESVE